MKKFLLYILLFFGIVVIVDIGFGYGCDWLQKHAKGGRMKGVCQSALVQTSDIVIMGSSRAHHHYVPSVICGATGMTAYNAGVDGNGIVLATGLYHMMAERYTPKVIIYDVEPAFDINVYLEDGNNTRYIGWLRPYYRNSKVEEIICRVDSTEKLKDLSAMFRYNGKIADLFKDQVVLSDYSADGYAPLQGEMKKKKQKKTRWRTCDARLPETSHDGGIYINDEQGQYKTGDDSFSQIRCIFFGCVCSSKGDVREIWS